MIKKMAVSNVMLIQVMLIVVMLIQVTSTVQEYAYFCN